MVLHVCLSTSSVGSTTGVLQSLDRFSSWAKTVRASTVSKVAQSSRLIAHRVALSVVQWGPVRKQQVLQWAFSMIEVAEERKGEVESQGN